MNPPARPDRISIDGTNTGAFDRGDWLIAVAVAGLWGSSFLWIAVALESLAPGVIAFGRVASGAAALWLFPAARRPIPRMMWPAVMTVAVAGNAAPALLFAFAQRSVDSSVAAMINSATPIAVLAVGVILTQRLPDQRQAIGIAVGLLGVVAIAAPSLAGSDAAPSGVALLTLAVCGYGLANNIVVEPQQQVGAVPVIARALTISALLLAPVAAVEASDSTFTTESVVAVTILGVGGTGIARALNATLAGRAGAARGSITTYLVPVVAIALGTTVRHEQIEPAQLAGTAVVLIGAWLSTRPGRNQSTSTYQH